MKKFNTFLRNENVVAGLIIAAVFIVTTIVSIWVYSQS